MANPLLRLSIRSRLFVVLIIFLIPIGLLGYQLQIKLTEQIAFSEQESKGAKLILPLIKLMNLVADYQIAQLEKQASTAEMDKEIAANAEEIDQLIAELETLDTAFGTDLDFTSEGLKKHGEPDVTVANLKTKWKAIKDQPAYSETGYDVILTDIAAMIDHAGNSSNLILDGDLDTYYLVDASLNVFPRMLALLAEIKTIGFNSLNANGGRLDEHAISELIPSVASIEKVLLPHAHKSITTSLHEDKNIHGISQSLQESIPPKLEAYTQAGKQFATIVDPLLAGGSMDAGAFVQSMDVLHDGSGELAVALLVEMDKMIGTRVHNLKAQRLKVLGASGIAVMIAFVAFFMVASSISRPIRHIQTILGRIADGETDIKIPLNNHKNEISMLYAAGEKLRLTVDDAFRLKQMVDDMPLNVITVDVRDNFNINYMNNTTVTTLKTLQEHLPVKVDEMLGRSFDIFHKNPEHQRRMVGNPDNLPHRAKIKVGPETLDLQVSAVRNKKGEYIAAMLNWTVVTKQVQLADNFESSVKSVVTGVSSSADQMRGNAERLSVLAGETKTNSGVVASSATEAAQTATQVAAAAEELTAAIAEISSQVQKSSNIANQASSQAESINQSMHLLVDKSNRVGEVIQFITNIASQINLLALNATIESARAGEAGRGFAVVASEVKNLANQTAKATEEIVQQVQSMQEATHEAVQSVGSIIGIISEISANTAGVAAAVEEQSAATNEISRNIAHTAAGTNEISRSIVAVEHGADETGTSSREVLDSAKALSGQATVLSEKVDEFLKIIRAS